ncbi:hypothetical protein [Motilimonas sp. KMU-193]|uniref:hypothetical protein n=1 Tax=Motilimonas sp. KMU-193 TaxID=3388668 RepID=UPI00396B0E2A
MQQEYYAATAYEYQYWKTTPTPEPHNLKGNHPLEFGDYARVVPSTYLKGLHASLQHASVVEDDGLFQFNHQCIRTLTGGRAWLGILFQFGGMLMAIAGGGFTIVTFFMACLGWIIDAPNQFNLITELFPFYGGFTLAGCIGLGLVRLPPPYSDYIFGKASPSLELNRQTGMITFWQYGWLTGRLKSKKSVNFMEFIPYLQPLVSPTPTAAGCNIIFVHKDDKSLQFSSVGLANFTSIADGLAWWDFIQCYMDVAEPLPNAPTLEVCRHLDPTTAKHDLAIGRDPRYWRDMSEQEYQDAEQAMAEKISRVYH